MWVHKAALEIAEIPLQAYFVPARDGPVEECNLFYAISPLGKVFLEKDEETWRRLTKDPLLTLNLWDDEQDEDCVSLEFPDQVADYKLKVEATCAFLPNARPFNPIACGMPGQKDAGEQWVPIPEKVKFKIALHRAFLRGSGFCDVLVPSADEVDQLADQLANSSLDIGFTDIGELLLPKRLPVIDLIDLPEEHLNALIEEALPADRQRFVKYLSQRPLGLGAITAISRTSAVPLCPSFAGASFA
ncbi:hypothetical protein Trihar35433_4001 [Trichoderma harzianum]|nr:hypothetical protein Trihar35433_4001 [Trichoderma harzianum]